MNTGDKYNKSVWVRCDPDNLNTVKKSVLDFRVRVPADRKPGQYVDRLRNSRKSFRIIRGAKYEPLTDLERFK